MDISKNGLKINRDLKQLLFIILFFITIVQSIFIVSHFTIQNNMRSYEFDEPAIQYSVDISSTKAPVSFDKINNRINTSQGKYSFNISHSSYIYHTDVFDITSNLSDNVYDGKIYYIDNQDWNTINNNLSISFLYYDYNSVLQNQNISFNSTFNNAEYQINVGKEIYSNVIDDICYCTFHRYNIYVIMPMRSYIGPTDNQKSVTYSASIHINQSKLQKGESLNKFSEKIVDLDNEMRSSVFSGYKINYVRYPLIDDMNNIQAHLFSKWLNYIQIILPFLLMIELVLLIYTYYLIGRQDKWFELLYYRGFSHKNLLSTVAKLFAVPPTIMMFCLWLVSVLMNIPKVIRSYSSITSIGWYVSYIFFVLYVISRRFRYLKSGRPVKNDGLDTRNHYSKIMTILIIFAIIVVVVFIFNYIDVQKDNHHDFTTRIPYYFNDIGYFVSIMTVIFIYKNKFDSKSSTGSSHGEIVHVHVKKILKTKGSIFSLFLVLIAFNNIVFVNLSFSIEYTKSTSQYNYKGDVVLSLRDMNSTSINNEDVSTFMKKHDTIQSFYHYIHVDTTLYLDELQLNGNTVVVNRSEYNAFMSNYNNDRLDENIEDNYLVSEQFYNRRISDTEDIEIEIGKLSFAANSSDFEINGENIKLPFSKASDIITSQSKIGWQENSSQINDKIDIVYVLKTNQVTDLPSLETAISTEFQIHRQDLRTYRVQDLTGSQDKFPFYLLITSYFITNLIFVGLMYDRLYDNQIKLFLSLLHEKYNFREAINRAANEIFSFTTIAVIAGAFIGLLIGLTKRRSIYVFDLKNCRFNPQLNVLFVFSELFLANVIILVVFYMISRILISMRLSNRHV